MAHRDGKLWKTHAQHEFERWAETYDQSILQRLLFQRCYLKFIELILKRCRLAEHGEAHLLDVGCGTGTFVTMLAETGLPIRPVGLDMAKRMCQIASDKARQLDLADRVTFLVADSERLPMVQDTFDLVTCSNSFHHYPHQTAVLAQMFQALKPGGTIIIQDGYRDNVIGWFLFDVCVARAEKSVHHCAASEMRRLLTDAGFTDVYQEKFGLWAPVLATVATKPTT